MNAWLLQIKLSITTLSPKKKLKGKKNVLAYKRVERSEKMSVGIKTGLGKKSSVE